MRFLLYLICAYRYRTLGASERKRLEEDEDRLLSTILYNLVAHMVMMSVSYTDIKRKVTTNIADRRALAQMALHARDKSCTLYFRLLQIVR